MNPRSHHIDRRATSLIADLAGSDDLYSTRQTADLIGCSEQWLEIGRSTGYGPPYVRLGPRMIRYTRSGLVEWLKSRVHTCTAEYIRPAEADAS
jgi:hypothetical protein